MLEIPECRVLAEQLTHAVTGRVIRSVTAGASPHKFAWFFGDPAAYNERLAGRQIGGAAAFGGYVELYAGEMRVAFHDGVHLRFLDAGDKRPAKHQLLIEWEDGACLVAGVQMYGGLGAFADGENDNPYYLVAKQKPSPLSERFDEAYFEDLLRAAPLPKLSAKAFLATEQRIPGLGNGVLQDILWNAKIHPKTKMSALSDAQLAAMFQSVKRTLAEMTARGGRDTERDLFGCRGGYRSVLSKDTLDGPCPACGAPILKQAYMGGSVYVCERCQPYEKPVKGAPKGG